MEANSGVRKLGSSLKVPNVQELAKEVLNTVPARYVRLDLDHPDPLNASLLPEIPVINMQKLFSGDSMDSELDKLHLASQEWGFFQLIDHGVDFAVVEKMKFELQEFFKLPMEEKNKFSQEPGDIEGYGQAFVVSEEQKLDWADMFYVFTLPTYLRKPHLIPKLRPEFREAIETYATELKTLSMKILNRMAKVLHMKDGEIETLFEEGRQSMRMNYYPPCPQPELVTGLSPHSDGIALTILQQINEVEGLQIKKDGVWIPISPIQNAFVINVGDMLEIVTNGKYRSIEHKATVNSKKERLSVATFITPKIDAELGPAPSLITVQTPANFKKIIVADFLKGYFARELHGKSYLEIMRI